MSAQRDSRLVPLSQKAPFSIPANSSSPQQIFSPAQCHHASRQVRQSHSCLPTKQAARETVALRLTDGTLQQSHQTDGRLK